MATIIRTKTLMNFLLLLHHSPNETAPIATAAPLELVANIAIGMIRV